MRLLALDTATEGCSVALLCGGEIIERFEEVGRGHADRVLEMVQSVLEEAGIELSALDGIAASVGPGSFTGVRISVAVAQGLAFGAALAVVPVTTLEALAMRVMQAGASHALACLDARMGEVYWGCFAADAERGLMPRGTLQVGTASSVRLPGAAPEGTSARRRYRGIGRGFAAYPALAALPGLDLDPADSSSLPHATDIARLGAIRLRAGVSVDPADLAPVYLRDKVALTEVERALQNASR